MTRDLKQYIEINRFFMTSREMADELGVPIDKVKSILVYNKWKAINEKDRIKEYIIANPGAVLEDVAEKFGCGVANIRVIAAQAGIALQTRLKAETVKVDQEADKRPFTPQQLREWAAQQGYGEMARFKKQRPKEAYTQSGSPYGIADELRKIKTK